MPRTPPRQRAPEPGRVHRHVVRLTAEEERRLIERAEAAGVTPARLLAEAALGNAPAPDRRVVVGELFAIRRQIQGAATNLNQLAHSANAGVLVDDDEVAAALDTWSELTAKLSDLLDGAR